MKVIVTYTARREVEIEIDDRFANLLDPYYGYKAEIALAQELSAEVVRKVNDKDIVTVAEVITAEDKETLWEW